MHRFTVALLLLVLAGLSARAAGPPTEWIDPDTGHRVIRLSREPGTESLYFNLNPYTPDGKKLIVTTPGGISTIDLSTGEIKPVIAGHLSIIGVGRKTGRIYYTRWTGGTGYVCAADPVTGASREVAKLPPHGSVASVNADETLLAGTTTEPGLTGLPWSGGPPGKARVTRETKGMMMERRLAAHLPMTLFTISLQTGRIKTLLHSTDWLNHLQFSPTDPTLLLFCHEGPWHKVDRIWLIRTDGSALTKVHARTMYREIAGHEFWSADGRTVWYDLQTPRGEVFWVAGYDVATGRRTWYHLTRDEWSVHYNVSPDGKLFAGDGGDSRMVAHAQDGKWIYLFRPELLPVTGALAPETKAPVFPGVFHAERLVNMSRHNYALEPNVSFTPDMKWVVFRSNMFGPTQVFAVEVAKATSAARSAAP